MGSAVQEHGRSEETGQLRWKSNRLLLVGICLICCDANLFHDHVSIRYGGDMDTSIQ